MLHRLLMSTACCIKYNWSAFGSLQCSDQWWSVPRPSCSTKMSKLCYYKQSAILWAWCSFALEKTFCSTCPFWVVSIRRLIPKRLAVALYWGRSALELLFMGSSLVHWSPYLSSLSSLPGLRWPHFISINKGIKCHALRLWWCCWWCLGSGGPSKGVERDNIVTQQDFDKKGLFSFMHALHLFIGFFLPYAMAALKLIFNYLPSPCFLHSPSTMHMPESARPRKTICGGGEPFFHNVMIVFVTEILLPIRIYSVGQCSGTRVSCVARRAKSDKTTISFSRYFRTHQQKLTPFKMERSSKEMWEMSKEITSLSCPLRYLLTDCSISATPLRKNVDQYSWCDFGPYFWVNMFLSFLSFYNFYNFARFLSHHSFSWTLLSFLTARRSRGP